MGNAQSNGAGRRSQQAAAPDSSVNPQPQRQRQVEPQRSTARVARTPSLILPDLSSQAEMPAKTASIPIKRPFREDRCYVQTSAHIPQEYHDRHRINDDNQSDDSRPSSYRAPYTPPKHIPDDSTPSVHVPPPQRTEPRGFEPCIVVSRLAPPIKFKKIVEKYVPVTITWKWGGNRVILARAGDDDWKGRQLMNRISHEVHSITISLLPGTHHLRFLVDDQWRVADDLPTAVDDEGSLANYVAVGVDGLVIDDLAAIPTEMGEISRIPIPSVPGASSRSPSKPIKSFWSSASTYGGHASEDTYYSRANDVWTIDVPQYLRDKVFITEMQAHINHVLPNGDSKPGPVRVNGFVPAPRVPDPPSLPKQLLTPLLNKHSSAKTTSKSSASTVVGAVAGTRGESERHREHTKRSVRKKPSRGHPTYSREAPPALPSHSPSSSIPPPFPHLGDTEGLDETVVADDTSVLPVPSHVVLHHVSTVAFGSDVLAMSSTVRYRGKYLTTVYYKPR